MSKGENIFKRKDGRWEGRYIKEYDYTGKIKYGYVYGKTYREAKEKVVQHKAAVLNGTPILSSRARQKLSFYCDAWLNSRKNKLKESTYDKYNSIANKYIKKQLGHLDPANITNSTIEGFTSWLIDEQKLSMKSVKDILVILHSIMKYTSKQLPGCMRQIEFVYPKEEKKEMRILTNDEQIRLVHYLMHDIDGCKLGVLLALYTGLRIGEVCALTWNDICLDCQLIKISSTVQRLKTKDNTNDKKTRLVTSSAKTDSSIRIIPMTNALAELCKSLKPLNNDAYVLSGNEKLIEPRSLQYRFKKYMKACSIEGIHFHSLRHTFATRCVEVGFEIKSLSEILGHSTTSITLNRYVHSNIELKRLNMNKLNDMMHQISLQ